MTLPAPRTGARSLWQALIALALGSMIVLAVPAAALAAPTWLAPFRVGANAPVICHDFVIPGGGTYVCDSEIAVTPAGTAYLGQVNYDGSAPAPGFRRASVSVRPPGGSFGPRQPLSPAGKHVRGNSGALLDMATNARGDVVMAWAYVEGTRGVVQAAYKPATASSFSVETLSNLADSADLPSVGIAADGSAVVIWRHDDAGVVTVASAFRAAGATNFGGVNDISSAGSILAPDVAIAPNGNAVAAWARSGVIEVARRPAGQAFGGAQGLSAGSSSSPDVEIAPNGRATVVWQRGGLIESRERTITPSFADGTWGATGVVTEGGESGSSPAVAVDPDNTAIVVWNSVIAGEGKVRAAVRPTGGSFSDHEPISAPGAQPFAPQVEVSPTGDAVATWALNDGSSEAVQSARRPRNGEFGGVDVLMQGTPGFEKGVYFQPQPTVAFDDQANAFATWVGYTCMPSCGTPLTFNEVAGFDAAPPSFGAITVPSTATTGRAAGMRASATDRMSATTVSWSFGDGATGTGGTVSRAYRAPGVYTVTITARDAVGNARSTTRTIQVANPSTGGGGGGGGGIDADRDGFFAGQDCNDNNAAIRPGALEIVGNSTDENCDGIATPFRRVPSTLSINWSVLGSQHRLVILRAKRLPRGGRAQIRCSGKRCKFKRITANKPRGGTVNLLKKLKRSQRTLRAGQTLEVRLTAPNFDGKVLRYKLKPGKIPTARELCLPHGTQRPQGRC
jgi:PKD domain/Putative metal-binding motif